MREDKATPRKRRRKQSLKRRYFTIVFGMVFVFLLGSGVFALGYQVLHRKDVPPVEEPPVTEAPPEEEVPEELPPGSEKINVAVFGVDKEGLHTDVVFVVSFDTIDKTIDLVSVPRDTKVTMTDEILTALDQRERRYPKGGVCKFNEVHAYAGKGYRNEYSVLQLEDLLGIDIQHYVNVDISGFRALVDAVGGVDFYVEQDLFYEDPEQDLYINLKAGQQHLDGAKAEQLVRFREDYAQKDLARIRVQQDFLKVLLKKITSTETILNNLPSLVYTAFKYVTTDVTVSDALKYVKYVKDIDADKVTMETIPGEGGKYFTADETAMKELSQRIFFDADEKVETPEEELPANEASRIYAIEILNGGGKDGLAADAQKRLSDHGYYVPRIDTFYGDKQEQTIIYVKKSGVGEDLGAYFKDAIIVIEDNVQSENIDIRIVLGTNER